MDIPQPPEGKEIIRRPRVEQTKRRHILNMPVVDFRSRTAHDHRQIGRVCCPQWTRIRADDQNQTERQF